MVAILVVLTIVLFLSIELALEGRRAARGNAVERKREPGTPRSSLTDRNRRPDADLLFHPGHTWARPLPNGLVEVGADDFAASFIGRVAAVLTPAPGAKLAQGEPAWTLVSVRGRRLPLTAPITGEVVAVAPLSAETPASPSSPEKPTGVPPWTLLVRPAAHQAGFANLFAGRLARAWRTAIREALVTRQAPLVGAVSPDGGTWHPQFGEMLDDQTWTDVCREFFPMPIEAAATEPISADAQRGEEWR